MLTLTAIVFNTLKNLPNAKLGFSKAIANGWIALDKKHPDGPKVTKNVPTVEDTVQVLLKKLKALELQDVPDKAIQDLKKRKLVAEQTVNSFSVTKGTNFSTKLVKLEVELTPEMLHK